MNNPRIRFIVTSCIFVFLTGCVSLQSTIFMKDPLTAEEHNNLGVLYEREGKYDLAIREYKKAISSDSSLITPVVNLGNVYLKKGEFTNSEKYYKKALNIDETNLQAANNLASLYIETGTDYKSGLNHMIQTTEDLDPVPAFALDTMGVLYLKLGDTTNAEKYLTEACNSVQDNEILGEEIRLHLLELDINKRCGS